MVAAVAVAAGVDPGAGVLEGFAFALEGAGGTSAFAAGEAVGDGVDVLLFAWAWTVLVKLKRSAAVTSN